MERPKCGALAKKKGEDEDWDERVTDAGDWKKVHFFTLFALFFFFFKTIYIVQTHLGCPLIHFSSLPPLSRQLLSFI